MVANVDAATEALIHTAASAMRALADMARNATVHKNNATSANLELAALKAVIGGQWQQPHHEQWADAPAWASSQPTQHGSMSWTPSSGYVYQPGGR